MIEGYKGLLEGNFLSRTLYQFQPLESSVVWGNDIFVTPNYIFGNIAYFKT